MEAETREWMAEIGPAPEWEGSPIDEIEALFARDGRHTVEEMWDGLPGAESFRDFHVRVVDGLEAALAEVGARRVDPAGAHLWHDPGEVRVVLVAHGGTNAVVLGHLLGLDPTPWEWERFDSAHTAVATLTTRPIARAAAFGMIGFGDITHLDPDMVTR
jgi:probable phosphoglycerate mutase